MQEALAAAEGQLKQLAETRRAQAVAQEKLQVAVYALELVQSRVANSAAHVAEEQVADLERQLEEARTTEAETRQARDTLEASVSVRLCSLPLPQAPRSARCLCSHHRPTSMLSCDRDGTVGAGTCGSHQEL